MIGIQLLRKQQNCGDGMKVLEQDPSVKIPPLEPDPKPEPKPDPEPEPGSDPDVRPGLDPLPEPMPL